MTVKYNPGFRKEHWSEYQIWKGIRKRCFNPKCKNYEIYGGKGVTMSDEWKGSFEKFYVDMGNRPTPNHSIDRIDPNGNYRKENCRWATPIEQSRNKSNNVLITYNGESKTLGEWSEVTGITPSALRNRIYRSNWTLERAFTLPSGVDKTRKPVFGEANKHSKLTEQQVLEIYYSTSLTRELMKQYNVCRQTICSIRAKKVWKHILDKL